MKVFSESERRRRRHLTEEGERLRVLLAGLRSAATNRVGYEPHDVTDDEAALQADAIEARLSAVTAAVDRIESGEYGLCRACGSAIADARLDAVPATDVCRGCA
jgi:RNA polymerase-binding transcription factor DksA